MFRVRVRTRGCLGFGLGFRLWFGLLELVVLGLGLWFGLGFRGCLGQGDV